MIRLIAGDKGYSKKHNAKTNNDRTIHRYCTECAEGNELCSIKVGLGNVSATIYATVLLIKQTTKIIEHEDEEKKKRHSEKSGHRLNERSTK